jgi:hypothetical protein
MKWFKIDGIEWKVRVFDPEESFVILYSENTGRTLDKGAPMVLDPLGSFFNYTLTVGKMNGYEKQFDDLWEYLSMPRSDALLVVLPKNRNTVWTTTDDDGNEVEGFHAYVSTGKRKIKKIVEEQDGELKEVIYDTFAINFIATKAQVLPSE